MIVARLHGVETFKLLNLADVAVSSYEAVQSFRATRIVSRAVDSDTINISWFRFGSREAANKARGPYHLLNRTGRAEEIAAGALFLACEESSFMTGADLLLDGGYLAFKGILGQTR